MTFEDEMDSDKFTGRVNEGIKAIGIAVMIVVLAVCVGIWALV